MKKKEEDVDEKILEKPKVGERLVERKKCIQSINKIKGHNSDKILNVFFFFFLFVYAKFKN